MNLTMRYELGRAWVELDDDDAVRVIVCSGEGATFSSGVDLADLADPDGAAIFRRDIEEPDTVCFTARNQGVRKPVIAAVNGLCVGGAFMWVVDADIAIAASDAQFVDPTRRSAKSSAEGRGAWCRTCRSTRSCAFRYSAGTNASPRNERCPSAS